MYGLYVERETVPILIAGEEIMVIARDRGSENGPPLIFLEGMQDSTSYAVVTGQGPDTDSFTNTPDSGTLSRSDKLKVDLSTAVTNDHNIYVVRCTAGKLRATVVSPHPVKTEFRTRKHP